MALTRHDARGFTLLLRNGGPPARYVDRANTLQVVASSIFAEGAATLELVETHGDTIVLAMIEREHWKAVGLSDDGCHGA